MGYHLHSLLLFKFEIKQNESNTNIVRNKIIDGFIINLKVESIICEMSIFAKTYTRRQYVNFREILHTKIVQSVLLVTTSSHCYYSNSKLNTM